VRQEWTAEHLGSLENNAVTLRQEATPIESRIMPFSQFLFLIACVLICRKAPGTLEFIQQLRQ
jgi:hypothetical protein